MNRSRSLLAMALVVTACQATLQTDVGGTAVPSPTVAPTESSTGDPAAAETPPPSSGDTTTDACISPDPTAETGDWPLVESADGEFRFRYPPDWQDISGRVTETIQVAFDQDTLAESGQPEGAELQPVIVRSAANGFVVVFELQGIGSSAITLHDRHIDKVEIIGDDVLEPGLARCLQGLPAVGFAAQNTDGSYYQSWFASRAGVAYHVLGLDPVDEDALDNLLQAVLSTWEWTE